MAPKLGQTVDMTPFIGEFRAIVRQWKDIPVPQRQWINVDIETGYPIVGYPVTVNISLFIRKAWRVLPPKKLTDLDSSLNPVLDLASFEVNPKGEGLFTRILEIAETECPWDFVFIENILESRLIPFLEKRGYQKMTRHSRWDDASPSYWKMLDQSKKSSEKTVEELQAELDANPVMKSLKKGMKRSL